MGRAPDDRREREHGREHREGVDDGRDGRARARANVGRRARDGAPSPGCRRRMAHDDVGDAEREQLGVGIVPRARHAVGDDGRQQRLDAAQHGDGEARRQQLAQRAQRQDERRAARPGRVPRQHRQRRQRRHAVTTRPPGKVAWKRLAIVATAWPGKACASSAARTAASGSATSGAGTRRVRRGSVISSASVNAATASSASDERPARLPHGARTARRRRRAPPSAGARGRP